jgi:hypothetical protein
MWTKEKIKETETAKLIVLYNETTGKSIKKFSDRATAELRTWKAIEQAAPPKIKKKRVMRFCFAPGDQFQQPRKGSLREKLFQMLSEEKGVLFSEIMEKFKWEARNTYEAVRLIHFTTNYGMWSVKENDDLRIRLIKSIKEYINLVNDAKAIQ